ncbi:MAG: P-loop NTPase fold protein, partial [Methylococcales bacterium]
MHTPKFCDTAGKSGAASLVRKFVTLLRHKSVNSGKQSTPRAYSFGRWIAGPDQARRKPASLACWTGQPHRTSASVFAKHLRTGKILAFQEKSKTMPPTLHSDEPTLTDSLDRQGLVAEIAEAAATATPPLVLGVHGDWGSGKTSFMKCVKEHLEQEAFKDRLITVWFEAWRYQNEATPLVALPEMRKQFSVSNKVRNQAGKIGEITFRSMLASPGRETGRSG